MLQECPPRTWLLVVEEASFKILMHAETGERMNVFGSFKQ